MKIGDFFAEKNRFFMRFEYLILDLIPFNFPQTPPKDWNLRFSILRFVPAQANTLDLTWTRLRRSQWPVEMATWVEVRTRRSKEWAYCTKLDRRLSATTLPVVLCTLGKYCHLRDQNRFEEVLSWFVGKCAPENQVFLRMRVVFIMPAHLPWNAAALTEYCGTATVAKNVENKWMRVIHSIYVVGGMHTPYNTYIIHWPFNRRNMKGLLKLNFPFELELCSSCQHIYLEMPRIGK